MCIVIYGDTTSDVNFAIKEFTKWENFNKFLTIRATKVK